jgi:hypothetical protein
MARSKRTKPVAEVVETQAEQTRQESVTPVAEPPAPEPERPAPPVTEAPDIFDSVIAARQAEARASTETPAAPTTASSGPLHSDKHAERPVPHIANPSSVRRESHAESVSRRLPDKLTITAGDLKVQLIDAGRNEMGIGIRVAVPEGRRLSDDEKAIIRRLIKGEDGEHTGFSWDAGAGIWLKPIIRKGEFEDQVPPSRPVAIRLDAERRVQSLAEALRDYLSDSVGYSERIQQQRDISESQNKRG